MSAAMRASGAGVVVLSCSDPRLNPYQILGIDATLSESALRLAVIGRRCRILTNGHRGHHGAKCRREGL
jgi:hypothetical protein